MICVKIIHKRKRMIAYDNKHNIKLEITLARFMRINLIIQFKCNLIFY